MKTNLKIGLVCTAVLGVCLSSSTLADTPTNATTPTQFTNPKIQDWKNEHPGQVEVNDRLKNQNKRIDEALQSGQITQQQAQKLHEEDMSIRGKEFKDAAQNGGKLTPQQVEQLNHEENQVNEDIIKAAGSHPQN